MSSTGLARRLGLLVLDVARTWLLGLVDLEDLTRSRVKVARRLGLLVLSSNLSSTWLGCRLPGSSISSRFTRSRVECNPACLRLRLLDQLLLDQALLGHFWSISSNGTRYRVNLSALCYVLKTHFPESSFIGLMHMTMRWKALSEGYNSHEDIKT